jgi:hypothetical protein
LRKDHEGNQARDNRFVFYEGLVAGGFELPTFGL